MITENTLWVIPKIYKKKKIVCLVYVNYRYVIHLIFFYDVGLRYSLMVSKTLLASVLNLIDTLV